MCESSMSATGSLCFNSKYLSFSSKLFAIVLQLHIEILITSHLCASRIYVDALNSPYLSMELRTSMLLNSLPTLGPSISYLHAPLSIFLFSTPCLFVSTPYPSALVLFFGVSDPNLLPSTSYLSTSITIIYASYLHLSPFASRPICFDASIPFLFHVHIFVLEVTICSSI
jgi:hypothetical protein